MKSDDNTAQKKVDSVHFTHIKCTSAEVVNKNILFISILIHSVSNCSSSWLIDDAIYIQARNRPSILIISSVE